LDLSDQREEGVNNLDRMIAIAVRIAEREGLLYEDEGESLNTEDSNAQQVGAANSRGDCHSPAIPFPNTGGTIRDDEGETF
jgi:hypothetical protein